MGTSGAYGGSSSKSWEAVRDLVDTLGGGGGLPADLDEIVEELLDAIGGQTADASPTNTPTPLAELIGDPQRFPGLPLVGHPRSARRSGGPAGRGGPGTSLTGSGRRPRSHARGAQLAGAGIGAGLAVATGDGSYLEQFGLSLDDLRGRTPAQQVRAIVDRVFGAAATPADYAARRALAAALGTVLGKRPDEINHQEVVRVAAGEFIFRQALIEIQDQLNDGVLDRAEAARREDEIRRVVEVAMSRIKEFNDPSVTLTPSLCQEIIGKLATILSRVAKGRKK